MSPKFVTYRRRLIFWSGRYSFNWTSRDVYLLKSVVLLAQLAKCHICSMHFCRIQSAGKGVCKWPSNTKSHGFSSRVLGSTWLHSIRFGAPQKSRETKSAGGLRCDPILASPGSWRPSGPTEFRQGNAGCVEALRWYNYLTSWFTYPAEIFITTGVWRVLIIQKS